MFCLPLAMLRGISNAKEFSVWYTTLPQAIAVCYALYSSNQQADRDRYATEDDCTYKDVWLQMQNE
jgi:hypothetical protein